MSSAYVTEPPTKGKVILKTTMGDIEIELWPKEAPKAVRNFVQLCLEGFYHDTIFHRIIQGFMMQGGDPTGTGNGNDSIYNGQPFEDEFHSRLRFSHRGLVACANQNAPHSNSCQFFITLDACEFLDRKNTIFGKVVGDTIYNIARMGELEVDGDDRPGDPPVITDVDVVWNPFEDIVPRTTPEERRAAKETKKPSKRKKEKRNVNLLSFGEDAVQEEQQLEAMGGGKKIKSAHDVIEDARLLRDDDAEALRAKAEEEEEHERRKARNAVRDALKRQREGPSDTEGKQRTMDERLRAKVQESRIGERQKPPGAEEDADDAVFSDDEDHGGRDIASMDKAGTAQGADDGDVESERDQAKRKQREFREQLRERREELAEKRGAAPRRPEQQVENVELLTDWQRRRAEYKQRKRLTGGREKETLAKLKQFQAKMQSVPSKLEAKDEIPRDSTNEEGAGREDAYDGKVRKDIDHRDYMPAAWRVDDYLTLDEDESEGLADLRSHKLVFSNAQVKDHMARTDNTDDYVVYDPLVEKQKEKFNKMQQRNKKLMTEWAGRSAT